MSTYSAAPGSRSGLSQQVSAGVTSLQADRLLGILGAVLVLVATAVAWYTRDVTVTLGGATANSSYGYSLWDVRELAGVLVAGAAVIAAIGLLLPAAYELRAGQFAALAGFGIAVYAVISLFAVPNLGSAAIVNPVGGASVKTSVTIGPVLAIVGGLLLSIAGIAAAAQGSELAGEDGS